MCVTSQWIQDEWGKRREEEVVVEVEEEKDTKGKKVWDTTTRAMEGWSEGVVDGEVEGGDVPLGLNEGRSPVREMTQKAEWKGSVGKRNRKRKRKGKRKGNYSPDRRWESGSPIGGDRISGRGSLKNNAEMNKWIWSLGEHRWERGGGGGGGGKRRRRSPAATAMTRCSGWWRWRRRNRSRRVPAYQMNTKRI
jgi:hypothetical protein